MFRLHGNQRPFGVVDRHVNHVDILRLDARQLGFKVLAAARGLYLDGNGAAVFQELGAERFRQADGVVVAAVKHDGGGFGFQIAGGQICPDHPLEAVRETDPADVRMVTGDAVVGGGGGDQRRFAVVGDLGHRQGVGGGDFPDHGIHFIAGDQALHGVGRFDFVAFIIDNDKLDGIAIF